MTTIDTTNMCSHLQRKLFEEDGLYHSLWIAIQDDPELTAVVRSRQLHIYRNGKKVLVLAGKSAPKVIREDLNYALQGGVAMKSSYQHWQFIDLQKIMIRDFIAIDFETANQQLSSVCSIGVVMVRNGQI